MSFTVVAVVPTHHSTYIFTTPSGSVTTHPLIQANKNSSKAVRVIKEIRASSLWSMDEE